MSQEQKTVSKGAKRENSRVETQFESERKALRDGERVGERGYL